VADSLIRQEGAFEERLGKQRRCSQYIYWRIFVYNSRGNPTVASRRTRLMGRNFRVLLTHVMHVYGTLEVWLHLFLTGTICRCDKLHSPAPTRDRKDPPPPGAPFNHKKGGAPIRWKLCSTENILLPVSGIEARNGRRYAYNLRYIIIKRVGIALSAT
jgi:hypothetical protein